MKKLLYYPIFLVAVLFVGCATDEETYISPSNTTQLEERLTALYGNPDYLAIPASGSLNDIPNDPKNPISEAKVTLGKLLFHETGLANNPTKEIGRKTYSCATCHHAGAGFQSKASIHGQGGAWR